jgi:hypothetical protein
MCAPDCEVCKRLQRLEEAVRRVRQDVNALLLGGRYQRTEAVSGQRMPVAGCRPLVRDETAGGETGSLPECFEGDEVLRKLEVTP